MEFNLDELFDFFTFANYGSNIDKEIQAEVFLHVLNMRGSTAYNRDLGTDAKRSENRPLNFGTELRLQNQIIDSLQTYNQNADDTTERRIAVPADSVVLNASNQANGELDVRFSYYKLRDLELKQVAA